MRRPLLLIGALLLPLLVSGWFLRRRDTAETLPAASPCTLVAMGQGLLFTHHAGPVPTRHLAWAQTESVDHRYLFIAAQNDHNHLVLAHRTGSFRLLELPKFAGLPEAFLRSCTLHRVAECANGSLLLHFVSEGQPHDPSLLACVNPTTGALLWQLRLPGTRSRLVHTPEADQLLFFGMSGPMARLRWVRTAPPVNPPTLERIELGAGLRMVQDALLLEDDSILLAHAGGLSRHTPEGGWTLIAPCPVSPFHPRLSQGVLVRTSGNLLWQPHPGVLFTVDPILGGACTPVDLPSTSVPLDRPLLKLLGADPKGTLWFALQAPDTPPQSTGPGPVEGDEPSAAWQDDARWRLAESSEWKAHFEQPLDRLYAWPGRSRPFQVYSWPELRARLGAPAGDLQLWPAQGLVATQDPNPAWWAPLPPLPSGAGTIQAR